MVSFCAVPGAEKQKSDNRILLEQYILQMAEGEKSAIEPFYEKTHAAIYGFILSILKNREDAEEILQDTYIRIYQMSDRYVKRGNPMPWIFTIARNLALMKIRSRKREGELTEEQWENIAFEGPGITDEEKMLLGEAMSKLSDRERQVVLLHAVAGLHHREIADILEVSLSYVLSKYHRSILKLRAMLKGV